MILSVRTTPYDSNAHRNPWIGTFEFRNDPRDGEIVIASGEWHGHPGRDGVLKVSARPCCVVVIGQASAVRKSDPARFYVAPEEMPTDTVDGHTGLINAGFIQLSKHDAEIYFRNRHFEETIQIKVERMARLESEREALIARIREIDTNLQKEYAMEVI